MSGISYREFIPQGRAERFEQVLLLSYASTLRQAIRQCDSSASVVANQ